MSTSRTDRHLLFGILALQNDLISRQDLIETLQAWTADKSRQLDSLLLERGALGEGERELLKGLVSQHVERHGGDATQSLAALSSVDSTLKHDLEAVEDGDLQDSLAAVSSAWVTQPPTAQEDASRGERFRVLRMHAKGGLGQVSVAIDTELNREVALKEIQPRHADKTDSRVRFLREAEITGALEHPSIVPVYGLGQSPDGRPYYVMRFIRGDSLHEAARHFHESGGKFQGERALEMRKMLGRFIDVCDAMEYAHSRGVLHRDLKPGNIMLGKYGETLVVDWGLAKTVDHDEEVSDEPSVVPLSGSGSVPTMAGSAVGTPAFMSPEQAAGRLDELGPASDIYSLGATLFFVLTGRMAVEGKDPVTMMSRVQKGEIASPRDVDAGIPKPLDAICSKAMRLGPRDRYLRPAEMAHDIERWLADEPVSVYSEPWNTRLARWTRNHKAAVTGAACICIVILIALAISTAAIAREQARTEKARLKAEENYGREMEQRRRAEQQRNRRNANFETALTAVDTMLTHVAEESLDQVPRMQRVRRQLLEEALAFYQELMTERSDDPDIRAETARAFRRAGDLHALLVESNEAEVAFDQSIAMLQSLIAEFPDRTSDHRDLGESLASRAALRFNTGRAGEAVADARMALAEQQVYLDAGPQPPTAGTRVTLAHRHASLAPYLSSMDEDQTAEAEYRQALRILDDLSDESYDVRSTRAGFVFQLATLVRREGRREELDSLLREALALQQEVVAEDSEMAQDRTLLIRIRREFAILLVNENRQTDAVEQFRANIDDWEALTLDFPHVPDHRMNYALSCNDMGVIHAQSGRLAEAEESFLRGMQIHEELVGIAPLPEYSRALSTDYNNLGSLYFNSQRLDESEAMYRRALAVRQQMVDESPEVPVHRWNLAITHGSLGNVISIIEIKKEAKDQERNDEAAFHLTRSVALGKELVAQLPENALYRHKLAQSYRMLGQFWIDERPAEAEQAFRQSMELLRGLTTEIPADRRFPRQLAYSLGQLARVLEDQGELPEAEAAYREAYEVLNALMQSGENDFVFRQDHAIAVDQLAECLASIGRDAEAIERFQEAIRLGEALVQEIPDNPVTQEQLADKRSHLARFLTTCGDPRLRDPAAAASLAESVLEYHPDHAEAWIALGIARYRLGQWQGAADAMESAAERLAKDDIEVMLYRAMARWQLGEREEALETFRQAQAPREEEPTTKLAELWEEAARVLEQGDGASDL